MVKRSYKICDLIEDKELDKKDYPEVIPDDYLWRDCVDYFLSLASQGGFIWKKSRMYRVTTSIFAVAMGISSFETQDDLVLYLSGKKLRKFTQEELDRMNLGTVRESIARDYYIDLKNRKDKLGRKYSVQEVGLAVPKNNVYLGGSSDGVVYIDDEESDGLIEIKCPEIMYKGLIKHEKEVLRRKRLVEKSKKQPARFRRVLKFQKFDKYYHDHIKIEHYCQMIGCMAIMKKNWTDYIVYCLNQSQVCINKVYFNQKYWKGFMRPKLKEFIKFKLIPLLEGKLPIIPQV